MAFYANKSQTGIFRNMPYCAHIKGLNPLVSLLFGIAEVLRCKFDTLAVNQRSTRNQGAKGIPDVGSNENRDWECLPRSVPSCIELAGYLVFDVQDV